MKISTPVIQAMHALGRAQPGDYIDWALRELEEGRDSKSLRVLAGLDRFVSIFEAEEYFLKSAREQSLALPARDGAIRVYAVYIAQQILQAESDFERLVGMMAELCYTNEYPAYLMTWYDLHDGLVDKKAGCYPHSFEALYGMDSRAVVEGVARDFIQNDGGRLSQP